MGGYDFSKLQAEINQRDQDAIEEMNAIVPGWQEMEEDEIKARMLDKLNEMFDLWHYVTDLGLKGKEIS